MEAIKRVYEAYSSRDDAALLEALERFQRWLIGLVHSLGPAAAMQSLHEEGSSILMILNKVDAQSQTTPEKLAFQAGWLSAAFSHFELIAARDLVDSANAKFSRTRDYDSNGYLIRMAILKTCFTSMGTRSTELVDAVAEFTKASRAVVKYHLHMMVEMHLLTRVREGPKYIAYFVTRLGEAIVLRRLHRYELALFFIDLASTDKAMRAAVRDEIKRTWPPDKQ